MNLINYSANCKERTSKSRYMFLNSTQYGFYKACHVSKRQVTYQVIRLSIQHFLQRPREDSAA